MYVPAPHRKSVEYVTPGLWISHEMVKLYFRSCAFYVFVSNLSNLLFITNFVSVVTICVNYYRIALSSLMVACEQAADDCIRDS
jgi:hypothetical protein